MSAVISCFLCLWFYIIYREKLQGGDAASYTSGFPTRLIYNVSFPTGPYTRLIPEMNFACNGVITGYTAALREQNGDQDPIIQIWRENTAQFGSYYKTSPGIAIDSTLCVGGLTEVSSVRGMFHCNLNQTRTRVSVQAGDILGLYLPIRDNNDVDIAFARVINGPTNYVFDSQLSMYSRASPRPDRVVAELPQITLEIGSESSCIRGFPDVPVSEVGSRTTTTNMTTLLIPEMNFTCTASIVGFIVSGRDLGDSPHSRVQIWRKNSRSYYQVGNVPIRDGACVASTMQEIVGDIHWCILQDNFRVSVQSGDILGLELPATSSDEILFTHRGPINYIFRHPNQLDSNTNLSLNGSSATAQQVVQISFNLTSVHCLSGFPEAITRQQVLDRTQTITRLFPELKFGCFGTIVRFTAAVGDAPGQGSQNPKIQIWREEKTRPGLYHKISSNVQIQRSDPPCIHRTYSVSSSIFQCTLREDLRISVQPGDFLGLEIPSENDDEHIIYFKAGGPTNLVFQGQLGSTVDLFTKSYWITNHEPQITFLVAIDETADSCPDISATLPSTTAAVSITTSSSIATTQDTHLAGPHPISNSITSVVVGGIIGGVIAILLLVAIILLTMTLIQLKKRKQHTINSDQNAIYDASPNPAYGVSSRRTVQSEITDHHDIDDISLNPAYGVSHQDMPQDGHDETPDYMII